MACRYGSNLSLAVSSVLGLCLLAGCPGDDGSGTDGADSAATSMTTTATTSATSSPATSSVGESGSASADSGTSSPMTSATTSMDSTGASAGTTNGTDGTAGTDGTGGTADSGSGTAGACGMANDSCSDSPCCDGFECCAGVPVPPGQEYCAPPGQSCPDSDVNLKQDFASVDSEAILNKVSELPISTWTYRADESGARHLGPMAQDFKAAFELGASDRAIHKIDADGVALAAIQGLVKRLEDIERDNEELREEVRELRAQLHPPK